MASLPLGYRFDPTDQEMIVDFLYHRIKGSLQFHGEVMDCDVYGQEDEWRRMFHDRESAAAAGNKNAGTDDTAMFFFTRPTKKSNEKGNRLNRVTKTGTWKIQKDVPVYIPGTKIHIGAKRSFKFVPGRGSAARGWIMHEFRVDGQLLDKVKNYDHNYVICKIKSERKKKRGDFRDNQLQEQQRSMIDDQQSRMDDFGDNQLQERQRLMIDDQQSRMYDFDDNYAFFSVFAPSG